MKKMTCKQLGGACDLEFHAETFEGMQQQSMAHGKEMFNKKDVTHLKAMDEMRALMSNPQAMQKWMDDRKNEFDALPEL